jgi:hypothetical protein
MGTNVIPSTHVDAVRDHGWTVVPDFVTGDMLRDAQDALWEHYRLAIDDNLVELAARVLGSDDLNLYKMELWAKYAGAASMGYDQHHHRDFGNHSIVVPQRADPVQQMTTFLLLSDVDETCGPTRLVPFERGEHVPLWPHDVAMGELVDDEVAIVGTAGSLFAYRTDILHRGSEITGHHASRFTLMADFQVWGKRWNAKLAWPHHAFADGWREMLARATVRQRALFGFPDPGDPYWDDQTIHDVGLRYPGMDMTPYRLGR